MRQQSRRQIWIAAGIVSALLLAVVLSRADIFNICHMAANVSAAGLLGALATLVLVNLVCSVRLARSIGPVDAKAVARRHRH